MKIKLIVVFVPLAFIQAIMHTTNTPCQNGIGDFIFIKKYAINGLNMQYVENSYPLTKGTSYLINICSKDCSNDMIISIFDRQRNLVTTNESNNKLSNSMRFDCNATGIYYMRYQSMSPGEFCGESILAFKRSRQEKDMELLK